VRRITTFLALLLAIAAVAAVPAGARRGAGGWTSHRTAAFGISAPASWVDMTRMTPQVLARARTIPGLADYVTAVQQTRALRLFLADVGPLTLENHFATNLNVLQARTLGDLRLQRDASVAQLRSSGYAVGPIRSRFVTLPAGRAVELRYHARFGAATPLLAFLQVMLVRSGKATVVTYTTLPKLEAAEVPLFRRSAHTFRFR
jgi:hypothetical protein